MKYTREKYCKLRNIAWDYIDANSMIDASPKSVVKKEIKNKYNLNCCEFQVVYSIVKDYLNLLEY